MPPKKKNSGRKRAPMTLVRPPRVKSSLQVEQVEEAALSQVLEALQTLSGQVRDLRTILMGDGDAGETPHGRIPMVESKVADHETRLKAIEAAQITASAFPSHEVRIKALEEALITSASAAKAYTNAGRLGVLVIGAVGSILGGGVTLFVEYLIHISK